MLSFVIVGILLSVLTLFLFIRKLEAVLFYSFLLGPSVGNSFAWFIVHLFQGNTEEAVDALKFLPFFLQPIDETFFGQTANSLLVAVGAVMLIMWFYVITHFILGKFGIWSLPLICPTLWGMGLSLPNLRELVAEQFPSVAWLCTTLYGIPLLVVATIITGATAFLYWRRTGVTETKIVYPEVLKLE